jgi:hypothetical protein
MKNCSTCMAATKYKIDNVKKRSQVIKETVKSTQSVRALIVIVIFCCLIMEKILNRFSTCFYASGFYLFLKSPVILKIGPENRQQRGAGTEILMRLSEQSLGLVGAFKEASRNY